MRNLLIYALALFGALLAAHLYIQEARGFDRGCLGLAAPGAEATPDLPCREVAESPAGRILGVNVAVPGFLFYALVALAARLRAVAPGRPAALAGAGLDLLLAAGFAFSAYLVAYQKFVLHAFCPLCLVSAVTVALLAGIRLLVRERAGPAADAAALARDSALYGWLTAAAGFACAALLVFVNGAGTGEARRADVVAALRESLPDFVDRKWLAQMAPCSFRADVPPLADFGALLPAGYPELGPAAAPVAALEFFDPNCPKCATLHMAIQQALPKFAGSVRFRFYPVAVHERSKIQVEALLLALEKGKFHEMMDAQYKNRKEAGLSAGDLADLAAGLGLDRAAFAADLAAGRLREAALDHKRFFYEKIGQREVPSLFLNGRLVARSAGNLSAECLENLIGELLADVAPLEDDTLETDLPK